MTDGGDLGCRCPRCRARPLDMRPRPGDADSDHAAAYEDALLLLHADIGRYGERHAG